MTAPTIKPDPRHVAALAEMDHKSDRIRYAVEHMPLGTAVPDLVTWLSAHGVADVRRSYAATIVKSYREGRRVTDTGDLPRLTPALLAELDAVTPDRITGDPAVRTEIQTVETDDVTPVFIEPPTPADPVAPQPIPTAAPTADVELLAVEPPGDPVAVEPPAVDSEPSTPEQAEPILPRRPGRFLSFVLGAIPLGILAAYVAAVPATAATVQAWTYPRQVAAALVLALVLAVSVGTVHAVRSITGTRSSRDVALDLASWVVAAIAGFLAAFGQVKFAEWAGVHGGVKWLVPGILEPSVVVLLLLANRRIKRARNGLPSRPIGSLLGLAALLGGFAVYTNVVHAGGRAGLVFGAATVVGLILWWVKLNDEAAPGEINDGPHSARLSRRTARYRWLRWVILFNQTRRAWLISLDYSVADAEHGLSLARQWRRDYDTARAAGSGRSAARQAAATSLDARLTR